jgi:hypothetical protein
MYLDLANSCPRNNPTIAISETHTLEIKHTAATLAENATIGLAVLAVPTAEEAKRATAIPDAVMMVLNASTYIFRLSMLLQAQPFVLATCQ